jgi:hypothetical protein
MTTRPSVRLPILATDDEYPAGPKPWAEEDTKLDPGEGFEAQGYTPEFRPAAQHWNYFQNALGQWVNYVHDMPLRNWIETPVAHWSTLSVFCGCYLAGIGVWLIGQDDDAGNIHVRLNRGHVPLYWRSYPTAVGANQDGPVRCLAGNDADRALCLVSNQSEEEMTQPDVWSIVVTVDDCVATLTDADAFDAEFYARDLQCLPSISRWLCIGVDSGDSSLKSHYTSDGVTWTTIEVISSGILSTDAIRTCRNPIEESVIVAVTNAADTQIAVTANGITWSVYADVQADALDIVSVGAIASNGEQMMILGYLLGSTELRVFTSDTGSAWVARATICDDPDMVGGLVAIGTGSWAACTYTDFEMSVWLTHDLGETWERVLWIFADTPIAPLTQGRSLLYADGVLMLLTTDDGGGPGHVLTSISC